MSLGEQLREMREALNVPQWKAASKAEMDGTLLSKIENGERLPTEEQLAALARFFRASLEPLRVQWLVEKMRSDYGKNPGFAAATAILSEGAGEYLVKRRPTAVSKRASDVNKAKKKK